MPRKRREWPTIPIGPILEHYGATVPNAYGDRWVPMRCPFHDDRSASASVNIERAAFQCHGCEAQGDAASLVRQQESLPGYRQGAERAREIAGVPQEQLQGKRRSDPATTLW